MTLTTYSHHRAMKRHGVAVCRSCEGSYWLLPVCDACVKGYVRTEEAITEYRLTKRHTIQRHRHQLAA